MTNTEIAFATDDMVRTHKFRQANEGMFKYVVAKYTNTSYGRFAKNKLVSCLPEMNDSTTLAKRLTVVPDYMQEDRELPEFQRLKRVESLARFMIPLKRLMELAQWLDATMVEGYAGREPHEAGANSLLQKLYESNSLGNYLDSDGAVQFSSALLGTPGCGKSFCTAAIRNLYPPCIFHPELYHYQIPFITIEMPFNGKSLATLADAILHQLDIRYPAGNYRAEIIDSRINAEQKLLKAFQLMHNHSVGMLHVDEAQNRNYGKDLMADPLSDKKTKGKQGDQTPLASLLMMASNVMRIPLFITGTPELQAVLGHRFSLLRRTVDDGGGDWTPLSIRKAPGKKTTEFGYYLNALWVFDWTKEAVELTPELMKAFYRYTAGVPDIIRKLYQNVQRHCIRKKVIISVAVVEMVGEKMLKKLPQIRAMQRNDNASLSLLQASSDLAFQYHRTTKGKGFSDAVRNGNSEAAVAALMSTVNELHDPDQDEDQAEEAETATSIFLGQHIQQFKTANGM